jgi:uncharacterized protein YbbC (DUF1343 family)
MLKNVAGGPEDSRSASFFSHKDAKTQRVSLTRISKKVSRKDVETQSATNRPAIAGSIVDRPTQIIHSLAPRPSSLVPFLTILHFLFLLNACAQPAPVSEQVSEAQKTEAVNAPRPAAFLTERYVPQLLGKRVIIVANQTTTVGERHLVDTLLALGVDVKAVFAPEHGFRGEADAGAKVKDGVDGRTGLPIISLYGKNKKPTPDQLRGTDLVLFDIQDVGARFYTYISTMSYVMEACAEQGIQFMVLDRPNPNGHYMDGPVLDTAFRSFVGLHPVPVVHGMTVAEYARMVNGEGWLRKGVKCDLITVTMDGYDRNMAYVLPERPSPNLPNMRSIYLYPGLCFFEGTVVSEGRGTPFPFQIFGHPDLTIGDTTFTPAATAGASAPRFKGLECRGTSFASVHPDSIRQSGRLELQWLIAAYNDLSDKDKFFRADFFDKLAGSSTLREQIISGKNESEIRASWQSGLKAFGKVREQYLLYP